jgi:hypothetical protein
MSNDAPAPAPNPVSIPAATGTSKTLPIAPEGSPNVLGDGPPRASEGRAPNQLSPELREKYAAILKQKAAAGETVVPDDDDVVPLGRANAAAAAAATASPAATPPPAAASAPPAAAPTPAAEAVPDLASLFRRPDPQAAQAETERAALARAEHAARESALAERERALAEQEARFRDGAERFVIDPVAIVRDYARASLPEGATEEQVKAAFADLVVELSFAAGGITPSDDEAEKRAVRKQLRELQAERKRDAKARAEAEAAARKAREEADAVAAEAARNKLGVEKVAQILPSLAQYPWLERAANPHEMIWNFADRHYQRTGEKLDATRTAQIIDKALEEELGPIGSRYHDLLSRAHRPAQPAATPAAAASTRPTTHQGGHQNRPSVPETAPAAPPAEPLIGEDFVEQRRRRTLAKWKAAASAEPT